jgi:hypothetical protein
VKRLLVEVSDEDWVAIMWNDGHGNSQTIKDAGGSYQFSVVARKDEQPELGGLLEQVPDAVSGELSWTERINRVRRLIRAAGRADG